MKKNILLILLMFSIIVFSNNIYSLTENDISFGFSFDNSSYINDGWNSDYGIDSLRISNLVDMLLIDDGLFNESVRNDNINTKYGQFNKTFIPSINNFSISFFINVNSASQYSYIMQQDGSGVQIKPPGIIRFIVNGFESVSTSHPIPYNEWVHIVITKKDFLGDNFNIYVNGVLNNTNRYVEGINTNYNNMVFLLQTDLKIDNLIIGNKVFNQNDVDLLYSGFPYYVEEITAECDSILSNINCEINSDLYLDEVNKQNINIEIKSGYLYIRNANLEGNIKLNTGTRTIINPTETGSFKGGLEIIGTSTRFYDTDFSNSEYTIINPTNYSLSHFRYSDNGLNFMMFINEIVPNNTFVNDNSSYFINNVLFVDDTFSSITQRVQWTNLEFNKEEYIIYKNNVKAVESVDFNYRVSDLDVIYIDFVDSNSFWNIEHNYSDCDFLIDENTNILNQNGIYCLYKDLSSQTENIRVQSNDIIIDGKGYSISGNFGILNSGGYDNLTIKNINFKNINNGIYIYDIENGVGNTDIKIFNNTFNNVNERSIYFSNGFMNDIYIYNNTINQNINNGIDLSNGITGLNNINIYNNNIFNIGNFNCVGDCDINPQIFNASSFNNWKVGIYVRTNIITNELKVYNNNIVNGTGKSIEFRDLQNGKIYNNNIINSGEISIRDSDKIIIYDNYLKGSSFGYDLASRLRVRGTSNNITFNNNILEDVGQCYTFDSPSYNIVVNGGYCEIKPFETIINEKWGSNNFIAIRISSLNIIMNNIFVNLTEHQKEGYDINNALLSTLDNSSTLQFNNMTFINGNISLYDKNYNTSFFNYTLLENAFFDGWSHIIENETINNETDETIETIETINFDSFTYIILWIFIITLGIYLKSGTIIFIGGFLGVLLSLTYLNGALSIVIILFNVLLLFGGAGMFKLKEN